MTNKELIDDANEAGLGAYVSDDGSGIDDRLVMLVETQRAREVAKYEARIKGLEARLKRLRESADLMVKADDAFIAQQNFDDEAFDITYKD
jgi:hypothetical protein